MASKSGALLFSAIELLIMLVGHQTLGMAWWSAAAFTRILIFFPEGDPASNLLFNLALLSIAGYRLLTTVGKAAAQRCRLYPPAVQTSALSRLPIDVPSRFSTTIR